MDKTRDNDFTSLSFRVLVVGCGLSGLATAIAMRISGHKVTVFERMPELREIGAGIQLSPNATRLFQTWNVSDTISRYAYQPEEGTLRSYRGAILSRQASGLAIEQRYNAPYLVIHRADLLKALVSEARSLGVEIKLGSNVASIDFFKPSINLSTGETFQGDVVLGADGETSVCREALLGNSIMPQRTGDLVFRIAVKAREVSQQHELLDMIRHPSVNVWMGPDAHAVSYMLKNDILNVVLVCPEGTGNKVPCGPQSVDTIEVQKAFCNWDPIFRALLQVHDSDCTKWPLLQISEVVNWCHSSGKFALIGDAAHAMLPYLAQGAAQAFEDAGVLGTLFAMVEDVSQIPEALSVYERLRKPRVAEVIDRTKGQKYVYGLSDGPLQESRDKQLAAAVPVDGCPNALDDPTFQKWLWGYDAILDARQAWDIFMQDKRTVAAKCDGLTASNMEIAINRAIPTDLPVLAEMNRLAYLRETVAQFAFTKWPDQPNMLNFFTARVEEQLHRPATQIFKAVEAATGEIVGFVCWTLEHADEDKPGFGEPVPTPTTIAIHQMPIGLDMGFVKTTGAEIESLKNHMKGMKHYYLSTFVVTPDYQRKGIGSQLLRHCLDIADQARLPTWLISFPGSHDLYRRFGFQDVDHRDVDLNAWDNFKLRGFGIYRSYGMLRQPEMSNAAA